MRDARGVVVAARVLAQTEHRAHRRVERVAAHRGARDGSFLGLVVDGPQRLRVPLGTRADVLAVVEDLPLAEPLQAAQPLALHSRAVAAFARACFDAVGVPSASSEPADSSRLR